MDVLPLLIPPLSTYIVATYCPATPGFNIKAREESESQRIIRQNVLPVISGATGFAWYFARNKAYAIDTLKGSAKTIAKASEKGSRKAVSKISKFFEGSQKLALDFSFIVLIVMINLWIYHYNCRQEYETGFRFLLGTIAATFIVIYLTAGYTTKSLLFLTPLLVWLLFTAQYNARFLYYLNTELPEGDVDQDVPQPPDSDKANEELAEQPAVPPSEIKEQFRIW